MNTIYTTRIYTTLYITDNTINNKLNDLYKERMSIQDKQNIARIYTSAQLRSIVEIGCFPDSYN